MKKLFFFAFVFFAFQQAQAQKIIKMFLYTQTESDKVFIEGTNNWKPEVPYKHFVRFVTEPFDIPESEKDYNFMFQFYEYLMKNYLSDFKKMKLHREVMRYMPWVYDDTNKYTLSNYTNLLKDDPQSRWQYETVLVKGFKYIPKKIEKATPLYLQAEKILLKGIE